MACRTSNTSNEEFSLFDIIDDQLTLREYADTSRPLHFLLEDVREGILNPSFCSLPELSQQVLALDLETAPASGRSDLLEAALDPTLGKIRLIQISDGKSIWVIDTTTCSQWKAWLKETLENSTYVIAHNARFECKYVQYFLGDISKVLWRCTHLASTLASFTGKHSLAGVLEAWVGVELPKYEQKSDWGGVLSEAQLLYAARDVAYLHELYAELESALDRMGMLPLYLDLECSLIPILAEVELRGIPVNPDVSSELYSSLSHSAAEKEKELTSNLLQAYRQYGDTKIIENLKSSGFISDSTQLPPPEFIQAGDLHLQSPYHILQLLASLGADTIENTSEETLAELNIVVEINGNEFNPAKSILEWKKENKMAEFAQKVAISFPATVEEVQPGVPYLHPVTKRLHTELKNLATGRLGATGGSNSDDGVTESISSTAIKKNRPWITNLQQFPRDPRIRKCFGFPGYKLLDGDDHYSIITDSGWVEKGTWQGGMYLGVEYVVVGADYSALEAFIAAHLSQDPRLIMAVNNPEVDFHTYNASICYNIDVSEVQPSFHRQTVKNVAYCKFYGGGPAKVMVTANAAFTARGLSTRLTLGDAEALCNKFDEMYPRLSEYMKSVVAYSEAHPLGETVPTKLGRKRYLKPEIAMRRKVKGTDNLATKAMNNPMQSTNADILKTAMVSIWNNVIIPYRKNNIWVELGPPVHDELMLFAPREEAMTVAEKMKYHMEVAAIQILSIDGKPTFPDYTVSPSFGPSWGHVH